MANTYDVGETVVLQATFTNSLGVPTTPSSFSLKIERSDGSVDTVVPTVTGTGVLTYSDTAEGYGTTWYRFVGTTSGNTVVQQASYDVTKQRAV